MPAASELPIEMTEVYETDICRIYRAKLKSESDAETWLRQYSEMTNSQWIVRIEKFLYRKDYVCHHAQFAKSGMLAC